MEPPQMYGFWITRGPESLAWTEREPSVNRTNYDRQKTNYDWQKTNYDREPSVKRAWNPRNHFFSVEISAKHIISWGETPRICFAYAPECQP